MNMTTSLPPEIIARLDGYSKKLKILTAGREESSIPNWYFFIFFAR